MPGGAASFHFGPAGRNLFGTLHRSEREEPSPGGVLLVPPFGHEAVRTHRLYRVLASRLARAGRDVLRFDPWGTGDSGGDDLDVDLAGWATDVLVAHDELAARTGRPVAAWAGARLGALVAVQALGQLHARAAAASLPRLALWDPVVDGAGYLAELREHHVEALEASYSVVKPVWRARLADPEAWIDEAIGFALSSRLRGQIRSVTAPTLDLPPGARVDLLLSPQSATAARAWAAGRAGQVRCRDLVTAVEWTSDDSLNTALVPTDALSGALEILDERPR